MHLLSRALRCLAGLPLLAAMTCAQAQVDLPPVDTVFVPKATATSRDRIEVAWTIAKGYYLYRHRMGVQPLGGFTPGTLKLPTGDKHRDEFFGDVETYRGSVTATLPGTAAPGTQAVNVRIKYQGCADAGICYPPQTRTLSVPLPNAMAAAAGAEQGGDSGFNALGASLGGGRSGAAPVSGLTGQPGAPLPPEQAFKVEAIADGGQRLLIRLVPAKGYYAYRDKLKLRLEGAPGVMLGRPQFPPAKAHHDEHFGNVQVYFDEATIPVPLQRTQAAPVTATLHAEWQGCQDNGICYPPMRGSYRLALPAADSTQAAKAVATTDAMPAATPPGPTIGSDATASATNPGTPVGSSADATIGTATSVPGAGDPTLAGQAPTPLAGGPNLIHPQPAGSTLPAASPGQTGLVLALLLAVLGGLVLNLMPCVLPVLSLKALSLAQSGESQARARRHALFYAAGILVAMAALWAVQFLLKRSGASAGWGFWMQSPAVVGGLGLLMFALGLSLSGLWALPGFAPKRLAEASGHDTARGDFLTGILAVIVATPCTGPFMVTALAYAFAAPALAALLVFLALGLGLALPVLLIAWMPALASRLPRPGAWMETLKQLLAFPMYLAAAWLVWVLAHQRGADAAGLWAVAAVGLAFALWAWARLRPGATRAIAVLAGVAGVLLAMSVLLRLPASGAAVSANTAHAGGSETWSPQRLAGLRAEGRVVLVNMTADWCITCKANERTVFSRPDFARALKAADAAYLVGDYTNEDAVIATYLQQHHAVGVPLYVVYPRGGGEGRVLPAILTPALVEAALAEAARQ